jgi:hypothetical protein
MKKSHISCKRQSMNPIRKLSHSLLFPNLSLFSIPDNLMKRYGNHARQIRNADTWHSSSSPVLFWLIMGRREITCHAIINKKNKIKPNICFISIYYSPLRHVSCYVVILSCLACQASHIFLFRRESCFYNTDISHSVSAFDQTKITILALSHTSIHTDVPKLVCWAPET